jgi:ubiquitin carboxyl-terminal hydrolase 8
MEKYNQYADKGLTGLANVGNTCYLNSCVQILSHTYDLNNFLNNKEYKSRLKNKPDSILLIEWDNLREMMWNKNCVIAPNGFVKAINNVSIMKNNDLFSGHNQNDISEFLLFILDCFHNSLSREVNMEVKGVIENDIDQLAVKCYDMMKKMYKNEYSEILEMFYAISITEIKSTTSNFIKSTPEPFCIISLSIPINENKNARYTLMDCMDEYCKPELLERDNAYMNDSTGKKEDVNKKTIFWSLPNHMIIDIKRYDINGKKLNNYIDIPINNVDFTKYVIGYERNSYIYDLYGVCNHSGGTLGGHYTCTIKNANGKWYEFNDTIISEVDERNIISNKSYCLIYRKK